MWLAKGCIIPNASDNRGGVGAAAATATAGNDGCGIVGATSSIVLMMLTLMLMVE